MEMVRTNDTGRRFFGSPMDFSFTFYLQGTPIGHPFLTALEDGAMLEWIEIFEQFRGNHLFPKMMKLLEKKFPHIILDTNENLKPVYVSFGYKELDYDDIREMYSMEKCAS